MAESSEQVAQEFASAINRHGFAFQAAVLHEARRLRNGGKSQFDPEVVEFPVQVQSSPTRIDLVLHHKSHGLLLVCECKRVNPAFANWCFAKMPPLGADGEPEWPLVDWIHRGQGGIFHVNARPIGPFTNERFFDLAFEIQSQRKGDSHPVKTTPAIEEAATQVCRGTNGLVEFYLRDTSLLKGVDGIALLPVIFSTADLWGSDVDLRRTDLATGEFPTQNVTLEKVPWLLYQYHVSPGVKHVSGHSATTADLAKALEMEYLRTIAIVSPSGIEEFLSTASTVIAG